MPDIIKETQVKVKVKVKGEKFQIFFSNSLSQT